MGAILHVNPAQLSRPAIQRAAAAIQGGEVVGIPTDTVYGLAADPFQREAVRRIFRLKGRPASKPMLLLVASLRQVEQLVSRLPEALEKITARF